MVRGSDTKPLSRGTCDRCSARANLWLISSGKSLVLCQGHVRGNVSRCGSYYYEKVCNVLHGPYVLSYCNGSEVGRLVQYYY